MGAKLVKFLVKPFPKTRVIGKSVIQKIDVGMEDRTIEDLWERMAKDGSLDFLSKFPNKVTSDGDTVGWMGDFQPGDDHYTYLAGIWVEADTPAPEGYVHRDILECEMAIAWIQETEDEEGGNIHANASDHINQAIAENGYQYDGSNGFFEMEVYSFERFRIPEKHGGKVILDFYSPCKRM